MNWGELLDYIYEKMLNDKNFGQESVTVYDKNLGEYYPCDTIEFEEGDDVLDAGAVFITIET
tara:strand:+ start:188 stop:373 length:186 start_codon:yes stop_codon:yes gene_type:complete